MSEKLTEAEIERLSVLAEECGEVIQVVGKILRWGYESWNPLEVPRETNRTKLEKELADINVATLLMLQNGDIKPAELEKHSEKKIGKINKWLHSNKIT